MESCSGDGGGGWRLRHVVLLVLLWMSLHRNVLGCSSTNCNLVLTEARGEFTSPCFPQKYPNLQSCKWTMRAPTGFVVQLSFLDFDLEEAPGCIYDQVAVNSGNAEVRFCGLTASGLTLNSTGNVMELSFKSDFSIQRRGFSVSFQHVAVALRNQKVKLAEGKSQVTRVADSVSVPTLSDLTVCFEVELSSQKQKESLFSYYDGDDDDNVHLSLGSEKSKMKMVVDGVVCPLDSLISPADFTSSMKPFCVTWTSSSGQVALYFGGKYWAKTCSSSAGHSVPAGGVFQLGGKKSFNGYIYNLRLWSRAMTAQELGALTCDVAGSVIDWDNSHWTIPSSLAETDSALSCSADTKLTTSCDSPGPGCQEASFYWISFEVESELSQQAVERAVALWLNQTFQNWTHAVENLRVQPGVPTTGSSGSYSCLVLLLISSDSLDEDDVSEQLSNRAGLIGAGLQFRTSPILVELIESCAEDNLTYYRWPKTRPRVTQFLPCFPNKDRSASRTCRINLETSLSEWSTPNITNCSISAEEAANVAEQLANITKNNLTDEEVSKVVAKVQELVNVAKIDSAVAETVVNIISNVMSSETAPVNTSRKALMAVEELAQKVQFLGPSLNISSRHLALGVLALNSSTFNGSSFSAFIPPNSNDPKVGFELTANSLAQVTLPGSLLYGGTLSEEDRSTLSRINFVFFSSTNLFKKEQDNRSLNSYVVASSVGALSIRNLRDPVKIEIAHLSDQPFSSRKCVFWDFAMSNGSGGWNETGCIVSEDSTSSRTICLCNHLTHFGILMDVSQTSSRIDPKNKKILTFLSYIGCGISAICSAATLLTYIAFEKLRRDYPSKILMNLSASLLFLNMMFLLDGWLASMVSNEGLCMTAAILLHYFLLTSFTWMGLESVHMYIALVKVFNTYIRRYILKFCMVGWGLPALLVGIVVTVDKNFYGVLEDSKDESAKMCWIKDKSVFYSTCVGYFCLVFLLNVAMFVVVMMQICGRNGKRSNRTLRDEVLRNLRSVVSLTFLLGMTWGFALFAWGPVYLTFTYLFTIFNSLQGLFIFIFHCALKENVQKQWRRYLCCGPYRLPDNSDLSKTATNNTKKVSSDNLALSLSSSSFGSSAANWTSKAKATLTPFAKRHRNTESSSNQ
ncbi:adhesion G-protein coupled receptor G6 isoform X2 [Leuresthes tenuis]|uniref:adhesion G-protein coupled receptor G6 isoform X2 n=1 Tax=Leuresthes tenuis TaxID=355514 RepID=UPI003B50F4F9